ncbi:MAG: tetraacyldisaccharide 4'-kinase [Rhodospirillaceae bacterium]|nr:tetraacyldisaccharide 4'-kinase [Rhodospirillaceae bacterium]|tara:strand:- start:555 stop:1532 length:978 start_codon:yes stop_codon:yes gene_type:complete
MLNRPKFWRTSNLLTKILTPLSFIYLVLFFSRKYLSRKRKVNIPVICIGNITAGGAGKTPVAISIAKFLISKGLKPHFLTRGYKGKLKGPILVSNKHSSADVGDEPILLSEVAPTWVSKNKIQGAKSALKSNADLIIMDDGLQNDSIHKDLSILVIDGGYGFGNNKLIPAGPLRESVKSSLTKIDFIVYVNDPSKNVKIDLSEFKCPILKSNIETITDNIDLNKKFSAFCGIARPEKFFSSLKKIGIKLTFSKSFPDHHRYSEDEIMRLIEDSNIDNSLILTTKKDWVRIPEQAKLMVHFLDCKIKFQSIIKLESNLKRILEIKK